MVTTGDAARASRDHTRPVASGDTSLTGRVLLIEDNAADAFLTLEHLRRAAPDLQCTHVDRLSLATSEVLAQHNCVILDLSLPDAHGLDALAETRHRDADVPILVLTGLADIDVGVQALRHGAQDYLLKNSVDGAALERAIRYAIERKRAEEALARAALHDPLTGLLNRTGFLDRLSHALARRNAGAVAVLFCDLDHFKQVNDSLGHVAGDDLLRQVAERIAPQLRPADTLARFGGDEFIALLEDLPDPADAQLVAERIIGAFDDAFDVGGQTVHIGCSIGITLAAEHVTPADMLRDADTAMYVAKDAGRARSAMFSPALHERAVARLQLEGELRAALPTDQLVLAYQPLSSVATGEPLFLEALSRWLHPLRGLLAPDAFLELAERCGVIPTLDLRALRTACAHLVRHPQVPAVSVNLSSRTLALPDLPGTVAAVLTGEKVDPSRIWIEVTEGALLNETATRNVGALRELGLRIALDDFGTGYSSLAYLANLRIDLIKIDKSFLPRFEDQRQGALLQAIAQLGHAIGIPVALEGIEDVGQMQMARDFGIDYVQGFLLGRPTCDVVLPDAARGLVPAQSQLQGRQVNRD